MKKALGILIAMAACLGVCSNMCAAASDCLKITFDNGDYLCLDLEKNGKNYDISVAKKSLENVYSIRCYITLPNNTIKVLNSCKGSFSYSSSITQNVTIQASYYASKSYANILVQKINFKNGTRGSTVSTRKVYSNYSISNISNSNVSNSDEIELSTNKKSPSTSQYVDLSIITDKKYTGKLNLSAQYRSSTSSSWTDISNTSSTYFSNYSSAWSNGYYKMTSSDKGKVTLSNLVKFKKNGYYRIYVKDTDNNKSYIQFNVGTTSSNDSDLVLSVSDSSPDTEEWIKLKIETDDDYTGKINFTKLQYKSSSSSSRKDISMTSSTYVSDYSNEWRNGYYKMTTSDDGEKTISKFIKFKKEGYYRIYAQDTDKNESYVQINVGTTSSNDSDLVLSVSDSSPDTEEWIKLKIETDDDYTGKINFTKLQYKASSSSSRKDISMTSSTYVSDYSNEWGNGYYKMTSSDDGEKTISKFIKFKKEGYYRIYAQDTDKNESYVQISVDTSSSSDSDEIELSTNRKTTSTNQYVNLTIETDDDYTGKLTLSAQYRSSSSSSWSDISNTSSTYFSDYSTEWSNEYYKMKSSDDGEVTLKNLVKFRKNGYYRIYVKDTNKNESYIQFNVGVDEDDDDDDESSVKGFSELELSKVKSVYKEWNTMIAQMKKSYPNLKNNSRWIRMSEDLYDDMDDVVNDRSRREFSDFDDFEDAFDSWYKYTLLNM